jgi:hypothetical protein
MLTADSLAFSLTEIHPENAAVPHPRTVVLMAGMLYCGQHGASAPNVPWQLQHSVGQLTTPITAKLRTDTELYRTHLHLASYPPSSAACPITAFSVKLHRRRVCLLTPDFPHFPSR